MESISTKYAPKMRVTGVSRLDINKQLGSDSAKPVFNRQELIKKLRKSLINSQLNSEISLELVKNKDKLASIIIYDPKDEWQEIRLEVGEQINSKNGLRKITIDSRTNSKEMERRPAIYQKALKEVLRLVHEASDSELSFVNFDRQPEDADVSTWKESLIAAAKSPLSFLKAQMNSFEFPFQSIIKKGNSIEITGNDLQPRSSKLEEKAMSFFKNLLSA